MQLEVHNQKLEKLLNNPDKLITKIGLDMTKMLKRRLNEMKAAPNFKDYINYGLGKPHALTGNLDKMYGINLNKNYRLIVEPLVSVLNDENLKECKNINIKGVVDYHDGKNEWLIP